jgi:mannose-6-phosphate isomerase-like protein (cupin superfamily)
MSMIAAVVRQLRLPLPESPKGWKPYPLFSGETASLRFMGCHVSVLSAGEMPHPPHRHVQEEILILLSGEADVIITEREDDPAPRRARLVRGQFSYYPAWQYHTLRCVSDAPATYLMFKWAGATPGTGKLLGTGAFNSLPFFEKTGHKPFSPRRMFDAPTRWLSRLHCHVTVLQPGGGYKPHADPYDIAIVLLSGTIETMGGVLSDNGVIYCSAHTEHGIRNPGREPARYLVFEFEGRTPEDRLHGPLIRA